MVEEEEEEDTGAVLEVLMVEGDAANCSRLFLLCDECVYAIYSVRSTVADREGEATGEEKEEGEAANKASSILSSKLME